MELDVVFLIFVIGPVSLITFYMVELHLLSKWREEEKIMLRRRNTVIKFPDKKKIK